MSANATIYFEPEGYSIAGPRLMGRNAAGHSFLRGLFKHADVDFFSAFTTSPEAFDVYKVMAEAAQVDKPLRSLSPNRLAALGETGCLYLPGPGLGDHAWQRRLFGERSWSLCGITHTTLSGRAMDAITGLLTAPVEPWDALICTSRAVRDTVRTLLEAQADYLSGRLGATRFTLPRLPVIPLGVETADFQFSRETREQARHGLGITEDAIVVLFVGRLSFHAKAHPAALYQALQAARGARPVVLIECGWFANGFIEGAFNETAELLAPDINRITLDGRDATLREKAWASADIFASLTDNLQETLGITPVEAMAAGLPVVVTDWDGYRDTVRHGIDGFRIPTYQPPPGLGHDIALRHAVEADNYDHYCGLTSQLVSVDGRAATEAFAALFADPDLRRRMGEAGRARARQAFDWATIIPAYQSLWAELAEERRSSPSLTPPSVRPHPWPARMEPFTAFASYASQSLSPSLVIQRNKAMDGERINAIQALKSFTLSKRWTANSQGLDRIMTLMDDHAPVTVEALSHKAKMDPAALLLAIAIGLKIGALCVAPADDVVKSHSR